MALNMTTLVIDFAYSGTANRNVERIVDYSCRYINQFVTSIGNSWVSFYMLNRKKKHTKIKAFWLHFVFKALRFVPDCILLHLILITKFKRLISYQRRTFLVAG